MVPCGSPNGAAVNAAAPYSSRHHATASATRTVASSYRAKRGTYPLDDSAEDKVDRGSTWCMTGEGKRELGVGEAEAGGVRVSVGCHLARDRQPTATEPSFRSFVDRLDGEHRDDNLTGEQHQHILGEAEGQNPDELGDGAVEDEVGGEETVTTEATAVCGLQRVALAFSATRNGLSHLKRLLSSIVKAVVHGLWRGIPSILASVPCLWRRVLLSAAVKGLLHHAARCRTALSTALSANTISGGFSLHLSLLFGAVSLRSNCSLQVLSGRSTGFQVPLEPGHTEQLVGDSDVIIHSAPSTPQGLHDTLSDSLSSISPRGAGEVEEAHTEPEGDMHADDALRMVGTEVEFTTTETATKPSELRIQVSPVSSSFSHPPLSMRYSQQLQLDDSMSPTTSCSPASLPPCGADPVEEPTELRPREMTGPKVGVESVDSVSLPGLPIITSQDDVSLTASRSSLGGLVTPRARGTGTPPSSHHHRPYLCRATPSPRANSDTNLPPQSPSTRQRVARIFSSPRPASPSPSASGSPKRGCANGATTATPDFYVARTWKHPSKLRPRRMGSIPSPESGEGFKERIGGSPIRKPPEMWQLSERLSDQEIENQRVAARAEKCMTR